jgi:hypothetical protein
MLIPRFHNSIGKTCALVAATLILPVLAHAQQNGTKQNNPPQNGTNQNVTVVPEVNTAWVLVPFLGAVLLYSWRRLSKAKA